MSYNPRAIHDQLSSLFFDPAAGAADGSCSCAYQGPELVPGSAGNLEKTLCVVLSHLCALSQAPAVQLELSGPTLSIRYGFPAAQAGKLRAAVELMSADQRWQSLCSAMSAPPRLLCSLNGVAAVCVELTVDEDQRAQPVLDLADLAARFEDESLGLGVLEGFIDHMLELSSQLESALGSRDWTSAHRMAHSLKGGALNVSAPCLAETARELEAAIKAGRYEELSSRLVAVRAASAELVQETRLRLGAIHG